MRFTSKLFEDVVKRSRWFPIPLILVSSLSLFGCGQALENALAPDPQTKTWSEPSSNQPSTSDPTTSQAGQKNERQSDPNRLEEIEQSTPQNFVDISEAPENLQSYIDDLARLEVLNPNGETADNQPLFSPNEPIKRGTFVRWLIQTRNRFNRDRPTQQFRLAAREASEPIYKDVSQEHPDFIYIQGLAEAGYLPSPLTGDTKETSFNPNANLTREILLRWKVPIDQQKLLPTVTTAKIQDTWGFKDAAKVSPEAASAIVADHSNQELSNIRRLVGASLLLQPNKAVTRAEAAAVLWYFGIDGQGLSAKDVIRADAQSRSSCTPS